MSRSPANGQPQPIVYDVIPDGHRANYVRLIAELVGGAPMIAPFDEARTVVERAPFLILPTFETDPAAHARLAIRRALAGRRTVVMMMRMHQQAGNRRMMRIARRIALEAMARLDPIQLLSITPVPEALHRTYLGQRVIPVADPEFWDVPAPVRRHPPATALSEQALRVADGRAILLTVGTIAQNKGLDLLAAIQRAGEDTFRERIAIVCAGRAPDPAHPAVRDILAQSDLVLPDYLSNADIFALYGASTLIWSCYRPDYDMSSGIYGRARQFGRRAIVRKGSLLAGLDAGTDAAIAIPFDTEQASASAARILDAARAPFPAATGDDGSARLAGLIGRHFGLPPHRAPDQ